MNERKKNILPDPHALSQEALDFYEDLPPDWSCDETTLLDPQKYQHDLYNYQKARPSQESTIDLSFID